MTLSSRFIDRREALRRAALLLGGAVSAPTIAAVLAGCEAPRAAGSDWTPRVLTGDKGELVATIAEHIIPETDTPGARSAGVHRFIDTMLAGYYSAAERDRFLAGLADVDTRARRASGKGFLRSSSQEQRAVLEAMDREAYARGDSGRAAPRARRSVPFFRTMKELTLLGYYTSQPGATRELQHAAVPGRFDGCVPLAQVGRAWAV